MKTSRFALAGLLTLLLLLVTTLPDVAAQETPYEVSGERPEGDQLVMVFMTKYSCAWSNRPEVIEAVRLIKRRLAAHADSVGRPFAAVGVSAGWDVQQGIEHLKKYGTFDEIISGGGWHNSAAVRYWHRDFPDQASTPQIILTEQTVEVRPGEVIRESTAGEPIRAAVYEYGPERLLYRATGLPEIVEWATSHIAVPEVARGN